MTDGRSDASGHDPCAACAVSRRTFLSAATMAAVVSALEACSSPTEAPSGGTVGGGTVGGTFTVKLSDFPALANVNGVARVEPNGSPTALVRTGASTFVAVSMVCTHQGTTVGIVSGGGGFLCPNHGARYGLTGTWTGGQVTTSLPTFTATFNAAAGTVTVERPA
jgi:cytochrome b6-f complex iron-sulfur subunit